MSEKLEAVDALPIGSGQLTAFAFAKPEAIGGGAEYEHRVTEGLSLFGEAHGGASSAGGVWRPDWGVFGGLRYRW